MNGYVTTDPLEHLFSEHRRLHVMIRLARSAIFHCGGPARHCTSGDVVRIPQHVREELASHFSDEESGHCFEDIAGNRPLLLAQARRLRTEHAELLRGIDRLIAQALDDRQTLEDRIAIEREFDSFCEQLFEHEAAENDLLRQGLASVPKDAVEAATPC